MQYKLVITGTAEQDLEDIAGYIANDLSSPKAAIAFLNDVDNCYENISLNPHMHPFCKAGSTGDGPLCYFCVIHRLYVHCKNKA